MDVVAEPGDASPAPVLIDATAVPADRAGVGRYVDELLHAVDREGYRLQIACQPRDEHHYRRLAPHADVHPVRGIERAWRRFLWEQTGLPRLAHRVGARLIHSPHYTMPLAVGMRRVVTFHDATFWSDPGVHTTVKRRFFPWWMRRSLARADAIVVPSRATADELTRHLGPADYRVVHHGVDHHRFRPPTPGEVDDFRERHGLPERWIAFLGTIEPRKNVPALVRGYADAVTRLDAPPALVLAGGDGWSVDLAPDLAEVRAPGVARRLGYLPLGDLAAFLGGAELVCYPSLAEGFGLPVLEAMACGAPVLTTRRLAIPEVAGEAAAYTEPDADAIRDALVALLGDAPRRAELARAGVRQAAGFTWAACARGHIDVWRGALGGHP